MPDKIHLTVATIVYKDNQFLMVRETEHGRSVINQPAGHVEPGEDIVHAAIRETLEETGWHIELSHFVGFYHYKSVANGVTYYRLVFVANPVSLDTQYPIDADIDEVLWMSADDIRNNQNELRSELVVQCIDDFLQGKVYPLDIIRNRL